MNADFDQEDLHAFMEEAQEHLRTLEDGLLALESGGAGGIAERLAEMFRAAHSIKGAAGMLGLRPLAGLTHQMENLLGEVRDGRRAIGAAESEALFAGVDALGTHLLELANGEERYDSAPVVEVLKAVMAGQGQAPPPAAEAPPPAWAGRSALWPGLPAAERRAAAAAGGWVVEIALALDGCVAGPDGPEHDALTRLATLSTVHALAWDAPPPASAGPFALRGRALVSGPADPAMLAGFVPVRPEDLLVLAGASAEAPAEAPAPTAPAPEEEPAAPAPAAARPDRRNAASIRVDAERLDHLMDVVGELVIGHTRIVRLGMELEGRHERDPLVATLSEALAGVSRLMGELQVTVMQTRMVPVERVFGKFQRLVRDLSKALGKDVRLDIAGADTELDKTVVEELEDPLVHLLRNAADHGLEPGDEREAAGKARTGTIGLAARREGNHIVVEVSDDGRGIDPAKVLAKARSLGLAGADAPCGDADALQYIFQPGFSTADRVTDVSGRGVGMDVVNQNIRRIKGQIHVHSVVGAGTRFEIRLPLTLAITKALLIRVAGEAYAIPLDAIQESIRGAEAEVHTMNGGEVIRLRDRIVPLLRLADAFGLPGARDAQRPIVVVNSRERPVGLVVDALEGEQDVVIKPLGEYLGRVAGVAGATILGDGRVALILDVAALCARLEAPSRALATAY